MQINKTANGDEYFTDSRQFIDCARNIFCNLINIIKTIKKYHSLSMHEGQVIYT